MSRTWRNEEAWLRFFAEALGLGVAHEIGTHLADDQVAPCGTLNPELADELAEELLVERLLDDGDCACRRCAS